jgi:hypothetical protein
MATIETDKPRHIPVLRVISSLNKRVDSMVKTIIPSANPINLLGHI